MIPIEIDHVVRFVVECFIPEAFDKVVVDKALHIVSACGNAQCRYGFVQSEFGIEIRQFTAKVSYRFASLVAVFRIELHKMLSDVGIGKLTGGTHLFVEVKEK